MSNELTQDAEESQSIEKTASEQMEATSPAQETAEAGSTDTQQEAVAEAPAPAIAEDTEQPSEQQAVQEQAAPEAAPQVQPEGSSEAEVASSPTDAVPPAPAEPQQPRRVTLPPGVSFAPAPAPAPAQAPAPTPAPVRAPAPTAEAQTESGDIDFGAILEQFEQEQTIFHPGQLVTGTVVGTTDRGVLVDFGYKSEGFVPLDELTGPDGQLTVSTGDTLEVVIRHIHSGDGAPQLSRTDALGRKVWDEIETAYQNETPIVGKIVDKTKGGLKVEINGIEAFLPGSQIDSRPIRGLDSYIGEEIEAKVIKFSRRRNNIVLSRKVMTDEVINAQKAETMSKLDIGYIVDGTIKNLTEYGAFVDIGGIDGLLHVTDMSWGRIQHPSEMFKAGEHVQVKVLKLDREKEKISLGFKQLQPDPWSTVVEVYPVDSKVNGKVSSVTDYGVFVELEPGVEGLVHVSEISWSRRAQSPKKIFHKGQDVEVQVLGVDTVEKRISLGMKQFQENPWDSVADRYPIGSRIQGRVRNITDFGAFVELEEGIDGLVHVSDISWGKKIKHPKDVLKKDQEVEAIVTSIDRRGQRLSLSMKDLTPSAWEGFVATHRPGDVVRGKVSRFTNFGIFVELGDGLEGLCHISELAEERVDRPEDVASLGQEMDFKILRIEPQDQKIGLSHRAVGKEDEPVVDTRIYSTEAKGGMASLGELANLKFGNAPEAAPAEQPKEKKKGKKEATPADETVAETSPVAGTAEPPATEPEAAAQEAPAAEATAETAEAVTAGEPAAETEAAEAVAEEQASVVEESAPEVEEAQVAEEAAPAAEADGPAEEPVQAAGSEEAAAETAEAPAENETAEPPTEKASEESVAEVMAESTTSDEPAAEESEKQSA